MMDPYTIILKPLLTEKNSIAKDRFRTLAFQVARKANKIEVAKAVQTIFKTKVEKVRIVNVVGKVKRVGRFEGKRADWKKAYVKIKKGQKPIEYFEGL
jgi:large subunit ribosomal protein L23